MIPNKKDLIKDSNKENLSELIAEFGKVSNEIKSANICKKIVLSGKKKELEKKIDQKLKKY